jgi:hypothetical protein
MNGADAIGGVGARPALRAEASVKDPGKIGLPAALGMTPMGWFAGRFPAFPD